jgi:hypothetical protein
VQTRFDGAFRAADDHGDLSQRELLEEIQDQDFTMLRYQIIQGLVDGGGVIVCEGNVL